MTTTPSAGPRPPARSTPPGDIDGNPLDPRARTLWTVLGAMIGGAIALAAGVVLAVLGGPWWIAAAAVPVLVVAGTGYARLDWRRWRWRAAYEALELRHGVLLHKASYVPYHRIQQIDVERGPLDRVFGLARMVVRTASATTDASLPGLAVEEGRSLRHHLLARAGADDDAV